MWFHPRLSALDFRHGPTESTSISYASHSVSGVTVKAPGGVAGGSTKALWQDILER